MPTDDNVPELVARLRAMTLDAEVGSRADRDHALAQAVDALESLHAEVERLWVLSGRWQAVVSAESFEQAVTLEAVAYHDSACIYQQRLADRDAEVESQRSIIDRQTNAYNSVAARLADRDAQIAEALALCEKESGEIRTRYEPDGPYTGYANACDDIAAILSRSPRGAADRAEVVTICGSTKFKAEILAEVARLTTEGKLVISLGVFGHTDLPDYDWTTDASDLKRMLDALHRQKIDMADRVHVVDVGGYYGESTAREIEYARSLGKPVTFMVGARAEGEPTATHSGSNSTFKEQA